MAKPITLVAQAAGAKLFVQRFWGQEPDWFVIDARGECFSFPSEAQARTYLFALTRPRFS